MLGVLKGNLFWKKGFFFKMLSVDTKPFQLDNFLTVDISRSNFIFLSKIFNLKRVQNYCVGFSFFNLYGAQFRSGKDNCSGQFWNKFAQFQLGFLYLL